MPVDLLIVALSPKVISEDLFKVSPSINVPFTVNEPVKVFKLAPVDLVTLKVPDTTEGPLIFLLLSAPEIIRLL